MLDGPAPDIGIRLPPPRVEVPKLPQNFTSLPEYGRPTTTESPQYRKPNTTESPEIDRLMEQILAQGKDHNPQAAIKQVEENLPQETKKPQGFWVQLKEAIKNFFKKWFS